MAVGVPAAAAVERHLLSAWRLCDVSAAVAEPDQLRAWCLWAAPVVPCSAPCLDPQEDAAVDLECEQRDFNPLSSRKGYLSDEEPDIAATADPQ